MVELIQDDHRLIHEGRLQSNDHAKTVVGEKRGEAKRKFLPRELKSLRIIKAEINLPGNIQISQ